jgi:hypothetical protein
VFPSFERIAKPKELTPEEKNPSKVEQEMFGMDLNKFIRNYHYEERRQHIRSCPEKLNPFVTSHC